MRTRGVEDPAKLGKSAPELTNRPIPFNKPFIVGKELFYISQAVLGGQLAGNGRFTRLCEGWMQKRLGANRVLLTHSCTAALEMCALLTDVGPGDEVIMPSYTFTSTANAFALRGARIRFVDIRADTLNIDETKIEEAITERTRVIVPVHYAGVSAEMDTIMAIARSQLSVDLSEEFNCRADAGSSDAWLSPLGGAVVPDCAGPSGSLSMKIMRKKQPTNSSPKPAG